MCVQVESNRLRIRLFHLRIDKVGVCEMLVDLYESLVKMKHVMIGWNLADE